MFKLFKEAFRSLSKNKVVIIGLTFLVFLTSGIFTLLFNLRSSFNSQINDYRRVSKLHDVTVDLNLPTNGTAYAGGYSVNNLTSDIQQYQKSQSKDWQNTYGKYRKWDDPIPFISKADWNQSPKTIINLYATQNQKNKEYIPLSYFNSAYPNDLYIAKKDFTAIYDNFKINQNTNNTSLYNFDFSKTAPVFTINQSIFNDLQTQSKLPTFNIYKQQNNKFVYNLETFSLLNTQTFTLDNKYSDISQISKLIDFQTDDQDPNKLYFKNITNLYINIKTHEMSFDYFVAKRWIDLGIGIRLSNQSVASLFGFVKDQKFKDLYILDPALTTHKLFEYTINGTPEARTLTWSLIKNSLSLEELITLAKKDFIDVFGNNVVFESTQTIFKFNDIRTNLFIPNQEYSIHSDFIYKQIAVQQFYQYHYDTTFSNKIVPGTNKTYRDLWSGSYFEFMSLIKNNDKDYRLKYGSFEEYAKLSYWFKKKILISWKADKKIIIPSQYDESQSSTPREFNLQQDIFKYSLIKHPDYFYKVSQNVVHVSDLTSKHQILYEYNASFDKLLLVNGVAPETSIIEIEKKYHPNWKNYNNDEIARSIYDPNIKTNYYNKISKGAEFFNSHNIIKEVSNLVGQNSVGYRKTMTVDGFNEVTKQKNVFHFINAGNENREVDGVRLNVGKLYNEHYSPTVINTINANSSSFYKTDQLPPYIAAKIISQIFANVNPDPQYFDTDIRFNNITIFDHIANENTNISQKIVVLAKYVNKANDIKSLVNQTNFANDGSQNIEYAITKWNNQYILLTRNAKNTLTWKNVDYHNFNDKKLVESQNLMNLSQLEYLFTSTNFYTLHYNRPINKNGWAKQDDKYKNFVYIPMLYRAPHNELLTEAYTYGTINYMMANVEQALLNLDIVKSNFIDVDFIAKFIPAGKKILTKANFGSVFASGKINMNIIVDLMLGTLYELVESNPGILNNLFTNFFNQIKIQIVNRPDAEAYFNEQYKKMDRLFLEVFNTDLLSKINPTTIFKITKNANATLDALSKLVNTIDFKKFLTDMHIFLTEKDEKGNLKHWKSVDSDGYVRSISIADIIKPLINSINGQEASKAVIDLIKTINFNKIFDKKDSIMSLFIKEDSPIWSIIEKLNANPDKTNPENNFINVKEGLEDILKIINFDKLIKNVSDAIKVEKTHSFYSPNKQNGIADPVIDHKVRVGSLRADNFIKAILNTLFANQSNNNLIKDAIVKLANLSSETTKVSQGFYIPKADDKKISLFDLLALTSIEAPTQKGLDIDLAKDIKFKLDKENKNNIKISHFNKKEKELIGYYLGFRLDDKEEILITELKPKIDQLIKLRSILTENNSLVDLANKYLLVGQSNGTISVVTNALSSFIKPPSEKEQQAQTMAPLYYYLSSIMSVIDNAQEAKYVAVKLLNFIYLSQSKPLLEDLNSDNLAPSMPNIDLLQNLKTTNGIINYRELANKWTNYGVNNYIKNYFESDPILKKYLFTPDSENKILFDKIKYQTFFYWAMLASSTRFSSDHKTNVPLGAYYQNQEKFIAKMTESKNFEAMKYLNKFIVRNSQMSQILWNFNISPLLLNPYLIPINTGTLLWFITNTNKVTNEFQSRGNLVSIIKDKILDFDALMKDPIWTQELINSFLLQSNKNIAILNDVIDKDQKDNLIIDNSYFESLAKIDKKYDLSVFGINLIKLLTSAIDSITYKLPENNVINFNDVGSYVAKVNFSYLETNNKAIYSPVDGVKLPSDPVEIQKLLNNIDQKYIINVNGSKFLIIGQETTVDYLYPVIDENNLQVNTKNQAIVYVNDKGFDRISNAYQGNVVKKYLLVQNSTKKPTKELVATIDKQVKKITGSTDIIKRVFLENQIDPINPERSIRISTPLSIIKLLDTSIIAIISTLVALVSVSIIFIIRRYIANKSKVIGILISQGYSILEISSSFLIFAFVTSIIGGIIGYIVGTQTQLQLMNIFNNYWTLPKQTISFNWFTLLFTVFIPFIGIGSLIILVSMLTLRVKSIELMQGSNEIKFGKTQLKISKGDKINVKNKFSLGLILNSIGKLSAFMFSILLTTVVSAFGVVSFGKFSSITHETFKNRNFNFKIDLETATTQGGAYHTYESNKLDNSIYTPLGHGKEASTASYDYFRPGYSEAINFSPTNQPVNGNVPIGSKSTPHIITQFSVNISIDAGVSVDPWQIAYNSMPDTQKAKVNAVRNPVGYALQNTTNNQYRLHYKLHDIILENTKLKNSQLTNKEKLKMYQNEFYRLIHNKIKQFNPQTANYNEKQMRDLIKELSENNTIYEYINQFGVYALDKNDDLTNYFIYTKGSLENSFKYAKLTAQKNYIIEDISTSSYRDQYRSFIINGYKQINNNQFSNQQLSPINNNYKDYYISFGGVFFDPKNDEKYTYISSNYQKRNIKVYGYSKDTKLVKLKDNLLEELHNFNEQGVNPLVINEVVAHQFNLGIGDVIDLDVLNTTNRFTNKLNGLKQDVKTAKFKVIGINDTYINFEFITKKQVSDRLTGLDVLYGSETPFNGIMSKSPIPEQVVGSSSLYALSGYWAAINNFDISKLSDPQKRAIFTNIFGSQDSWKSTNNKTPNSVFEDMGWTLQKVEKFLGLKLEEAQKTQLDESIQKFSEVFEKKLYVPLATSIDSKDIEAGFTLSIANTIESLLISIIIISFIISIIILVIVSTILINENEKNIAIFSILGYSQAERIKLFFSIFVPFMLLAIILSIPITILALNLFMGAILSSSSIFLPLTLSWWPLVVTIFTIITVFVITTSLAWYTINKMKAIDLLKGK